MSATAAAARAESPDVQEVLCLDQWDEHVRGYEGTRRPLPDVKAGDAVQIQYTSGTTGNPKGALLHHRGLVNNASFVAARAGLDHGVLISPMPLFHTSGSSMSVLGTAATRSTYVLPLMFEPEALLAATERWRGEVLFGVPTMMMAMLEHPSVGTRDLSSLRVAVSGGAPVPADLLRRVEATLGCDLISVYGQTEMSPVVSQTSPDDTVEDKATTSGRPLWHVEVKVVSPTTGEIVPIGQEGEICARGYQRMLGYFEDLAQTAKTVDAEGWLHSGDLGKLDERGYLTVTGRLKDLIIRGGENISPAEIEARLFEHPGVAGVAVFGVPDDRWGEVVCAVVRIADPAAPPPPSELKRHCRETLAPQKAPERWFVIDEFPLTGSGKVQKFRLQDLCAAGALEPLEQAYRMRGRANG
jgi:fatty-acyl-CoA synthase/long-chain acyl-CoA synthetase